MLVELYPVVKLSILISQEFEFKLFTWAIFLSVTFIILIIWILSKKGFYYKNENLYRGYFIGRLLLIKQKLAIQDKPVCAILKSNKRQKYGFFSAAKPDLANKFGAFDIYLLNENHTAKNRIMTLKHEKNSQKAIDFIMAHTDLKFEVYCPRFY
ncbi:hypothetical protein CLV82_2962 [Zeaxanthinibacter enoshimensis]|uniref:Uncharacterized protein n=1 Tax=Zeaxanthinibacter enoshimensis TaxID=392009 RepID=A0A4R6TDM2_9FLAO|nr:hypothetical protein CLV82_2962 [Zeaxanthinibacter enoshimensis]